MSTVLGAECGRVQWASLDGVEGVPQTMHVMLNPNAYMNVGVDGEHVEACTQSDLFLVFHLMLTPGVD